MIDSNQYSKPFLDKLGFEALNKMQQEMWDKAQTGKDVILLSPTGSGKTLAFLLPLTAKINRDIFKTQALIIAPTRELAIQIHSVLKSMSSGISSVVCYGGHSIRDEKNTLQNNPQVVVATPGRCNDHIRKQNLKLGQLQILVLDEFDKSLELGFQDDIKDIVKTPKSVEQFVLTSATDNPDLPGFVGISKPIRLDYISNNKKGGRLNLYKVISLQKDKIEALFQLLCNLEDSSTLVFLNYRDAVERVHALLKEKGMDSEYFHGGLEQKDRELKLMKFRNGSARLLITTDLSSRGLDIPLVKNVIHYQLPSKEDQFTHRNGRTARMMASGNAFVLQYEQEELKEFIPNQIKTYGIDVSKPIPSPTNWLTLELNKGKKDKIGKIDVLGFITKIGGLSGTDVGNIDIKPYRSYVAIARNRKEELVKSLSNKKIKGKSVKVQVI